MILHNKRSYLGSARPTGSQAWFWNIGLSLTILVLTVAGVTSFADKVKEAIMARRSSKTHVEQKQPERAVPNSVHARRSGRAMATEFEIIIYGQGTVGNLEAAADEALEEIQHIDQQMSLYINTSDVCWINANASTEPVQVEPGLFSLLKAAAEYNAETNGAFDITVGPLLRAWGFFAGERHVPTDEELRAALESVGLSHVRLDDETRTVSFDQAGVEIDLGGIAKGYAVDCAAQVLKKCGGTTALVNGGTSSVYALGAPPGEDGWTVGVQNPKDATKMIDTILLKDAALSTSGSYEKFFKVGDELYCHILDPRTGYPVQGMLSATAIAPTATASDALSTAFFVLGVEQTKQFCASHKDIGAILVPEPEPGGEVKPIRVGW
jgi:thiamine biosynthesis lipoprotein